MKNFGPDRRPPMSRIRVVVLVGLLSTCAANEAARPMFFRLGDPAQSVIVGEEIPVRARWAQVCSSPILDALSIAAMDKNGNVSNSAFTCGDVRVEVTASCNAPCLVTRVKDGIVTVAPLAPGAFSFELRLENFASGERASQSYTADVRSVDAVGLWCTSTGKNFTPCTELRATKAARVQVVAELGERRVTLGAFRVNGRPVRSGELGVSWAEFAPDSIDGGVPRPGRYVFELEAAGLVVSRTLEVNP